MNEKPEGIDTVLKESRRFPPSESFRAAARWGDDAKLRKLRQDAAAKPENFWATMAEALHWDAPWRAVREGDGADARWFPGAKLNASVQCLDRHLPAYAEKQALIWEGEDGTVRSWTYRQLYEETCRIAAGLKALGAKPGDPVAIYLPLVPEAVAAMLACARIGAPHSVIFAGFASHAIRDRVLDAGCRFVLTADVGYRRGEKLGLLATVEGALAEDTPVEKVVVLWREKPRTSPLGARLVAWDSLAGDVSAPPEAFDANHPLFFLYTSGTTGKPKGILHGTGGYMVQTSATTKYVFDLQDSDRYWCTADIGWITGHSYVVYGVLANAATAVLYEGNLMSPTPARIWEIVDRHKVTILYTAPTAIRSFVRAGDQHLEGKSLASLRLLGSVGEPINPEAWMWYFEKIGKGRCPIVDTWWQTETGAILLTPLPGATTLKPGSATLPFPGIDVDIVDEEGKSVPPGRGGYLVVRGTWPSLTLGIHGDRARYLSTYWSRFPGIYFTGDGAHRDADGYFWIQGRVDDVLNVSGHRLGTAEIESALVSHKAVAEAAVVGRPDDLKGQAIAAFVIPRIDGNESSLAQLRIDLKKHVAQEIGALARPDDIRFTRQLPKTRSGKILRRLLRDLAAGKTSQGDTSTLENAALVEFLDEVSKVPGGAPRP